MSIDKKKKRKEKKRNINNDLANLPSHDTYSHLFENAISYIFLLKNFLLTLCIIDL